MRKALYIISLLSGITMEKAQVYSNALKSSDVAIMVSRYFWHDTSILLYPVLSISSGSHT